MFGYRVKVRGMWREFDLRPFAEVPRYILEQGTEEAQVWAMLEWGVADQHQMQVIDSMPMYRVKDMVGSWQQDSGIEVWQVKQMIETIADHGMALEADLIDRNLRLRDCPGPQFNWRDLWVVITYLGNDSHLVSKAHPERAGWTPTNLLLADIADAEDWLVWSKTRAAHEHGSPPDRRIRPGVLPPQHRKGSNVKAAPLSKIKQVYGLEDEKSTETPKERQRKLEALFR